MNSPCSFIKRLQLPAENRGKLLFLVQGLKRGQGQRVRDLCLTLFQPYLSPLSPVFPSEAADQSQQIRICESHRIV